MENAAKPRTFETRNRSLDIETCTRTATSPLSRVLAKWVGFIVGVFQTWFSRQQSRRELAQMSRRDFGDICVPPGLIGEEARRWPWQSSSEGWGAIRRNRRECRCNAQPSGVTHRR